MPSTIPTLFPSHSQYKGHNSEEIGMVPAFTNLINWEILKLDVYQNNTEDLLKRGCWAPSAQFLIQ